MTRPRGAPEYNPTTVSDFDGRHSTAPNRADMVRYVRRKCQQVPQGNRAAVARDSRLHSLRHAERPAKAIFNSRPIEGVNDLVGATPPAAKCVNTKDEPQPQLPRAAVRLIQLLARDLACAQLSERNGAGNPRLSTEV